MVNYYPTILIRINQAGKFWYNKNWWDKKISIIGDAKMIATIFF